MVTEPTESWKEDMTGRERVRAVTQTLEGAATVSEIADRAGVSPTTAGDELAQLESANRVRKTLVGDQKGYELNPAQMFFDELLELIEEHTRDELEAQLEQLKSEEEALHNEFEVDSLTELRERLIEQDLSADETKAIRNAASTWEALQTELTLVRHALRLYDDVTDLNTSAGSPTATV